MSFHEMQNFASPNMADPLCPATMRAVQYTTTTGGLEKNLVYTTSATAPPSASTSTLAPGSTLVRVSHASLNPADYKFPELPVVGRLLFARPCVPGADFAGTVVRTASPNLAPGQTVFGRVWGDGSLPTTRWGSLAEFVVVPAHTVSPGPGPGSGSGSGPRPDGSGPGVTARDLACLGTAGLTAYQAVAPYAGPGERVLINGGSGGVGTFAIQVAKARGCLVTAVCSASNAALCRSLGADDVVEYDTVVDVAAHLSSRGQVYDHVLDAVCQSSRLYFSCHGFLKPGRVFVSIGGDSGLAALRDMVAMFCLPACLGGGKRPFRFLTMKPDVGHYARLAEWMRDGKVRAVVEDEFELERAADAFRRLKSKRTKGKLVVRVAAD